MLKVKLLHPDARLPTVAHPGDDLGYDLYAIEDVTLYPGKPVRCALALRWRGFQAIGFILGDRSSMAARGITYAGGRIDAGYRGELLVCLDQCKPARSSTRRQSGTKPVRSWMFLWNRPTSAFKSGKGTRSCSCRPGCDDWRRSGPGRGTFPQRTWREGLWILRSLIHAGGILPLKCKEGTRSGALVACWLMGIV